MKSFKEFLVETDKWIHTDPNKAGMFDGVDIQELKARKEALKKQHASQDGAVSDTDRTKMAQLEFAIRAKSKSGL